MSLKRPAQFVATLVSLAVALVFTVLTLLPRTGLYATYTVLSDSMQPAIGMGSVVLVVPADPASLQPGDIISYTSAQPPYPTITHRIVGINRDEQGRIIFKTKGDYNPVEDSWDVHYASRAGLVVASIPLAGFGVAALTTSLGRALLGVLLAVLLAVFWFGAVWAKPRLPRHAAAMHVERAGPVSSWRVAIVLLLAAWFISGRLRRIA